MEQLPIAAVRARHDQLHIAVLQQQNKVDAALEALRPATGVAGDQHHARGIAVVLDEALQVVDRAQQDRFLR